jgi:hypothetical protein
MTTKTSIPGGQGLFIVQKYTNQDSRLNFNPFNAGYENIMYLKIVHDQLRLHNWAW